MSTKFFSIKFVKCWSLINICDSDVTNGHFILSSWAFHSCDLESFYFILTFLSLSISFLHFWVFLFHSYNLSSWMASLIWPAANGTNQPTLGLRFRFFLSFHLFVILSFRLSAQFLNLPFQLRIKEKVVVVQPWSTLKITILLIPHNCVTKISCLII